MDGDIDPQTTGKVDEAQPKAEGQDDELTTKTKTILGEAADWASDQLKNVSARFTRSADNDSDDAVQPSVADRPPAPVTGDEGARAAGKVEDDIT